MNAVQHFFTNTLGVTVPWRQFRLLLLAGGLGLPLIVYAFLSATTDGTLNADKISLKDWLDAFAVASYFVLGIFCRGFNNRMILFFMAAGVLFEYGMHEYLSRHHETLYYDNNLFKFWEVPLLFAPYFLLMHYRLSIAAWFFMTLGRKVPARREWCLQQIKKIRPTRFHHYQILYCLAVLYGGILWGAFSTTWMLVLDAGLYQSLGDFALAREWRWLGDVNHFLFGQLNMVAIITITYKVAYDEWRQPDNRFHNLIGAK